MCLMDNKGKRGMLKQNKHDRFRNKPRFDIQRGD